MDQIDKVKCEAPGCDELAQRIIHGHNFCAAHRHVTSAAPVARCDRDGCGLPAAATVKGQRLCRDHARWAEGRL